MKAIAPKMQAALLTAYGAPLQVRDVCAPRVNEDHSALLKIESCGICRSDWHLWSGDWAWRTSPELPHIMGHEIVGVVADAGDAVNGVEIGTRVVLPFHLNCGECRFCRAGNSNICENYCALGFQCAGGFAERLLVPRADLNLVPVAPGVDHGVLAFAGCRLGTAFHAAGQVAAALAGGRTLVLGFGGLGRAVAECVQFFGGGVTIMDPGESARTAAFRAEYDVMTPAEVDASRELFDVVFDTVGGYETSKFAIRMVRSGGHVIQLGLTGSAEKGSVPIPMDDVTKRALTIHGSVGTSRTSFLQLIERVQAGRLGARQPHVDYVVLEEASQVLAAMTGFQRAGPAVIKL